MKSSKNIKQTIKNIWFTAHMTGMFIIPFIWIIIPEVVLLYLAVIISWKLNNNKCILSELEFYFFNETFLGKGKKCFVPKKHRNILYINTILGTMYLLASNKQAFLKLLQT